MIKKYLEFIKESKDNKEYSSKNLILEICSSMVLLNNEFLDNILDRGLKARYSENSQVFLTDLKNLLLSKNRLRVGKFVDNKCEIDEDFSKLNGIFESVEFNIEKDWSKLIESRSIARNIIDKLLPDQKISSDRIIKIYWLGPNKDKEHNEDIVIELDNNIQYSIFLNKNLSLQKSASFNSFADDLIPEDISKLYSEEYINKWNKLTQEWIKIVYECSNKDIQEIIEKFIDVKRIDSIGYFEYFDIKHRDPKYKFLGEYIKEFEKNILKFPDLMNEIWKNKETCLYDIERAQKEWTEIKIVILNSKILEHIFTTSLTNNKIDEIEKVENGLKRASGTVKMKLVKTLVDKIGCVERPIYYLSDSGNTFYQVPSREFFRKHYDQIDVLFDYHVKFEIDEDEDNNDFNIRIKLMIGDKDLIGINIIVKFSGGEFSGKLNAKYKYSLPDNFNYLVSKIEGKEEE